MQERGQVMTCINLLALNNKLYCSHLELRLRLLEMAATAALSDLREGSYTADNAAQLIRWIYDLIVIDPNQDHSKKASTKVWTIIACIKVLLKKYYDLKNSKLLHFSNDFLGNFVYPECC